MIISGHNFAHVTTAELLWHVQNLGPDLIITIMTKAKRILVRFQLSALEMLVKRAIIFLFHLGMDGVVFICMCKNYITSMSDVLNIMETWTK